MLIDTHAHLNFKAFDKDLTEVINRAQNSGVEKIIIPGAKIDSSQKAVEISQKYEPCFAVVGIHPHHVEEFINLGKEKVEKGLKGLIKNKKVMAVGEIGLDYHTYKGYPAIDQEIKKHQKELLILQIEIAQEYNLPVIFHCRNSHDDQIDIIKDKQLTGVFHCFGGEKKHLRKVLDMGFYVGFDGNITYPENKILQELVKHTPTDRLLLETDSPYLTPLPYRGQRNEPANLTHSAAFVAKILNIPIDDLADITSNNALRLFRL